MEIREDAKAIYPAMLSDNTIIPLWFESDYQWAQWVWKVVSILYFNFHWHIFTEKCIIRIEEITEWTFTILTRRFSDTWYKIIDSEIFAGRVYITTKAITSAYVESIPVDATDLDWDDGSAYDTHQLESWYSNYFLHASDVLLAVWNWNKISKFMWETPTILEDWLKLQPDYKVQFIDELWWYIRVTATDWYYGSEVLLWNKVSESPTEVIPLNWYRFIQSHIYEWYHYLLSTKWLWLLNWYQYYILKETDKQVDKYPPVNWMCVYDDKLYFNSRKWTFIYWAKNKNYNEVLSLWQSEYQWWTLGAVSTDWTLFVSSDSSKRGDELRKTVHVTFYSWDKSLDAPWFVYDWELRTMAYYGWDLSEIKQATRVKVWYSLPKSQCNIKIYYRTEADDIWEKDETLWTWHEITPEWWLKQTTNTRAPFSTELKLNCRFQWIQFKFVLRSYTDSGWDMYDTKLYNVDLYYNSMLS